jgi:hypothetical protein
MAPFNSVLVTVPGELRDRDTGRPMVDLGSGAIGGSDAVTIAPDGTWALYAEGSGMWLRYPFFPEPLSGSGMGVTRARVAAAAPGSEAVAVAGVNMVDNKPELFVFRVSDGVMEATAIMDLSQQTGQVSDLAWSPDGSRLAVAASTGVVVFQRSELGL